MFLDLPTDRTRPSIQNFEGGKVSFNLSQKIAVDLAELGSREGATIFMVLLAAFQTLLFRYSEQEEFLVGVPIAGRTIQEVAGVMGLFVNTLALRVNFSGLPSFDDILTQTRRVVVEAFGNQDIPFEQVVTALQPERTLSHSPLFQVMFAYHNFSLGQGPVVEGISGLTVAPINLAQQTAKFDLTMFVEETVNGLNGAIEYRKDLFEEETIQRMARHFEVLLKGIVESPQKPVMSLPLLSQEERHQVLVEWNNTQHEYPNCCLQELIEAQVIQTPNDTAVIFEDFQMTYDELNQRANRVAHYLRKAGVGPDALVGIFLNRSIDMMVVLLGVLKAGGAYVPIDLSSPTERIRKIIIESEMLVLFTENSLSGKIPSPNSYSSQGGSQVVHSEFIGVEFEKTEKANWPRVVCLEEIAHELEQEPNTNPSSLGTPDNLAYVIYTSGTTGNSKGVMIPHRGLVNYLFWCSRAYHLKGGIGSLVHSSIGKCL